MMNLQTEQIRAMTLGADRVTEEKDGLRFHRFTEEQEAFYHETSPEDFYIKTFATAGVGLAFRTDSRTLALRVRNSRGSSRKFGFVDVEVNGEFLPRTVGSAEDATGEFAGRFDLGEGQKTVRVYFPQLLVCTLCSLELDDGATLKPLKPARRMLIFGDSITQGYDALYPSHSYATRLATLLDADARNKGIGGEVFQPRLALAKEHDFAPDLITVAYGTNDWGHRDARTLEMNLREFYRNLAQTYPNAKIFALSPVWRGKRSNPALCGKPFAWIDELIADVARELPNVTHIPGIDFVPHDPACYSPDILHPNDIGFATYAERAYHAIKAQL